MNIYTFLTHVCVRAVICFNLLANVHFLVVWSVVQDRRDRQHLTSSEETNDLVPATAKQIRWAESAWQYLLSLDCTRTMFISERDCQALPLLNRSDVNVYIADSTQQLRFQVVLPDDNLATDDHHSAVLVIDPFPSASFGHLVHVFYIDLNIKKTWCEQNRYAVSLENGECMTMALKRRCDAARDGRSRRRMFAKRCKVNFIPLVFREDDYLTRRQQLTCRSNIPGFGQCPELRPLADSEGIICHAPPNKPDHCDVISHHVHTNCRMFETCDQAVIVSGAWNRWTSRLYQKESVDSMYHLFKSHGFTDANIKVFYANGAAGIPKGTAEGSTHEVYPAIYKTALRRHIQQVCSSIFCAETFVIYINGPSRMDGATLLWDRNHDGVASDDEMYKTEEILGDIANCRGNAVHLIVDQSYSGELAEAVKRSQNHRNVAVYASSRNHEHSVGNDFSRAWHQTNHTNTCMREIFKSSRKSTSGSSPSYEQGRDVRNTNIFGAPCNMQIPFSFEELQLDYRGCQGVPTSHWIDEADNRDAGRAWKHARHNQRRQPFRLRVHT